jgi:plastocyanin
LSRTVRLVLGALTAAALVVPACNGDDADGSASGDAQAAAERAAADAPLFGGAQAEIVAVDNEYEPEVLKVRTGTDVTFTNEGRLRHDVLPVDGGGFEIPLDEFEPDDERTFTLTDPGVFRYYCTIHGTETSGMIGTLAVVE